jgi:hypothetical protein
MYNPDAVSDCMKQMGRREPDTFIGPAAPTICPACAFKHGEQQCWGHQCSCPCNQPTFASGAARTQAILDRFAAALARHLERGEVRDAWEQDRERNAMNYR